MMIALQQVLGIWIREIGLEGVAVMEAISILPAHVPLRLLQPQHVAEEAVVS